MNSTQFRVDATDGQVRLRDAQGAVWLGPCTAAAILADGTRVAFDDDARPESGVDGLVVRQGRRGQVELRWHFEPRPKDQALAVWLGVYNATDEAVGVTHLEVLSAPAGLAGALAKVHHEQPWLVSLESHEHRLLVGFAGEGTHGGRILGDPGLVAIAHPPVDILPPGGLMGSDLLVLVADHPDARRVYDAAVAAER